MSLDAKKWTEQKHNGRKKNNTANRDDIDFKENNVQMRGDNSEVILDDGSKTYIFRKKIVPTISRHSTVKRKSVLPDGYIPSHRDNIVTLQDKVKMLREQETLHGVVTVFRFVSFIQYTGVIVIVIVWLVVGFITTCAISAYHH